MSYTFVYIRNIYELHLYNVPTFHSTVFPLVIYDIF